MAMLYDLISRSLRRPAVGCTTRVMFVIVFLLATTTSTEASRPLVPIEQSEWSQVVGNNSAVSGGFGNLDNWPIRHLVAHNGQLFAVTYNEQNWLEIWKSRTGLDWTRVHSGGLGAEFFIFHDLVSFKGFLYAASSRNPGCLWRSSDGADWAPVEGPCADPDSLNEGVWRFGVFGDELFAGTQNLFAGCEIWHTSDGESWEPVMTGGFKRSASCISAFEAFHGQLYASTDAYGGCDLWRSSDGSAWIQVLDGCFPTYDHINELEVFEDTLYAGASFDGLGGFSLWSSSDGINWTFRPASVALDLVQATDDRLFSSTLVAPFEVLVSSDGCEWGPDNEAGFGNPNNYGNSSFGIFEGYLYVATKNSSEGSEVWRTFVGLFADGFESGTFSAWSFAGP